MCGATVSLERLWRSLGSAGGCWLSTQIETSNIAREAEVVNASMENFDIGREAVGDNTSTETFDIAREAEGVNASSQ